MTRRLEILLAACLYYSGLVWIARWWMKRSGKKLVVLCYHQSAGGHLRQHMLYLKRHYRILHLEAALEELYNAPISGDQRADPRPLLALTFDDGYYDTFSSGFSLANELQIPITVFLIPGYIESGNRFWWEESDYLLLYSRLREVMIAGRAYRLDRAGGRRAAVEAINTHLSRAVSVLYREKFLASLREIFALPLLSADTNGRSMPALTWAGLGEMGKSQWISFGAHTMNHPVLAHLADLAEIQHEVSECRVMLERHLERPVYTFAYPHGKPEHIGENGPLAVEKAGYKWALTTIHGFNTCRTNPYLLRRIVVDVDQHWLLVAAKACGVWDFFVGPFRALLHISISILRRTSGCLRYRLLAPAALASGKVLCETGAKRMFRTTPSITGAAKPRDHSRGE